MYGRFAAVYDELMRDVDYDAWAQYIESFLPPGCSVLECACGTGELTLRLARSGFRVVAADISADMLRVAREKAGRLRSRVALVQMDMRALESHRRVDAVVSACDGVNYLASEADVKRFFRSAHGVLKEGGALLFDISTHHKFQTQLADKTIAEDAGDVAFIWRSAYDAQSRIVDMDVVFFARRGELYERFEETHRQRGHAVEELSAWLGECGFDVIGAFDAFTREAARSDSERVQFAARRM